MVLMVAQPEGHIDLELTNSWFEDLSTLSPLTPTHYTSDLPLLPFQ